MTYERFNIEDGISQERVNRVANKLGKIGAVKIYVEFANQPRDIVILVMVSCVVDNVMISFYTKEKRNKKIIEKESFPYKNQLKYNRRTLLKLQTVCEFYMIVQIVKRKTTITKYDGMIEHYC